MENTKSWPNLIKPFGFQGDEFPKTRLLTDSNFKNIQNQESAIPHMEIHPICTMGISHQIRAYMGDNMDAPGNKS